MIGKLSTASVSGKICETLSTSGLTSPLLRFPLVLRDIMRGRHRSRTAARLAAPEEAADADLIGRPWIQMLSSRLLVRIVATDTGMLNMKAISVMAAPWLNLTRATATAAALATRTDAAAARRVAVLETRIPSAPPRPFPHPSPV